MKFSQRIRAFSLILVMMTIGGCGSLDEAVFQAKKVVPGDWHVLYAQPVEDQATVVFYIKGDELGAGLFQKETFGWNWLGSGLGPLVSYPEGLLWRYSDLGTKKQKVYLYYGLIQNPEISSIEVKTTWGEVSKAQIAEAGDKRLWYAFISRPQVPSVDADITGYTSSGEVGYLFSQPKQGTNAH